MPVPRRVILPDSDVVGSKVLARPSGAIGADVETSAGE
jgi:hypothetical protein